MRDDPYESVVPFDLLDTIVEWLARDCPADGRPPRSEKTRTSVMSPGAETTTTT